MNILVKNKYFRRFSVAQLLSGAGDSLFYLALMTYASNLSNYSLALSLIAISESLPKVLNILGGYYADKTVNKLKAVINLNFIRFFFYLLVTILFLSHIIPWYIVIISILINLISDSLGSYSTGLQLPLIVSLVNEDEVSEAAGITNGLSEAVVFVAQLIGSGLLIFISYAGIALVNAITFLLAAILFLSLRKVSNLNRAQSTLNPENSDNLITTLKKSFYQLKKSSSILPTILLLSGLNGIIGSIEPLLSIVIAANKNIMVIGTYSLTITLVGGAISIGIILGGIFGPQIFKRQSIFIISIYALLVSLCILIAVFFRNILVCLGCLAFLGLFIGTISPKMMQQLVKIVDNSLLASTMGALNTFLVISAPIMVSVLTTISGLTNVKVSLFIILALDIMLLIVAVDCLFKKLETE
ncbi:MFS family permease [Lactobacillus colini]|uniref:MFS family permease n=1 Tax=Lactobacillus colini TaxID=1819254 RepID=A0ABS4MH06_9LACO|nr:MFS transporter [Lactobacillus colini]MBP2058990.1 MFS family permease [Lactobacillus colini]